MTSTESAGIHPVYVKERIQILDILRGFAILGILMVNMPMFNSPFSARMGGFELFSSLPDQVSNLFIRFFFEGKFYSLFSILFGIGFYLFLQKKVDEGKSIIPTFRWRLFYLLLFGILHITLLWYGDILFFYALFGFTLILFKKKSAKGIKKWIIALILIPIVLTGLGVLFISLGKMIPEGAAQIEASFSQQEQHLKNLMEQAITAYSSGSFSDIVSVRLTEWRNTLGGIFFFYPNVFAMFLLGFYIAKKGWLFNIKENKAVFKKMFWYCLFFGLIGNLMYTVGMEYSNMTRMTPLTLFSMIGFGFGVPSMTLFYISAFVLLLQKGWFTSCLERISYVGRMALTNYLVHSIICTTLFYNYGFGLYGKINLWQGIIIVIAIYVVQVWYSKIWLKHFYFGPFEWLWRTLSYRKRQVFRIEKS
ncbi:MAG TPA: DUF418 domain-containing protein [Bacteroidales bacterium]|nr:DUF418 domain-containing protein [Bacteroidales bacterium]